MVARSRRFAWPISPSSVSPLRSSRVNFWGVLCFEKFRLLIRHNLTRVWTNRSKSSVGRLTVLSESPKPAVSWRRQDLERAKSSTMLYICTYMYVYIYIYIYIYVCSADACRLPMDLFAPHPDPQPQSRKSPRPATLSPQTLHLEALCPESPKPKSPQP